MNIFCQNNQNIPKTIISTFLILFITCFMLSGCGGSSSSGTSPISNSKLITSYSIENNIGIINQESKTITVTVPAHTNLTSLIAKFRTTGNTVTVESIVQVSGVTANNFESPVIYTVIADNGSTSNYTVTVSNAIPWTQQVGAESGDTKGEGVSSDNTGNAYIAGYTSVGISGQTQNGNEDYFIAKYESSGALLWTKQVGAESGDTEGYGVSSDQYGNAYVVGHTSIGISGQTQNGNNDYFIAKYESNGTLLWTQQVGAESGDTEGYGISSDKDGNIYITGYTSVGISGQTQNGNKDYFIAKYESNGTLLWTQQVGAESGDTEGKGVHTDPEGNIYVTGSTTVGISGQTQNGNKDYFIAKYQSNGTLLWTKQVGAESGDTEGYGISTDYNGNSYVTGVTSVGLSGESQNGNQDYFIAKYESSGTFSWSKQVGAESGNTEAKGIHTDLEGNSYITGATTVGLSGQTQNGVSDYFVAMYNNIGTLQLAYQVGTSGGTTVGEGISVDIFGNIYTVGWTNIGISGQTQTGNEDYFISMN